MQRLTLWQSMSLAYGFLATAIIVVIGAAYYLTSTVIVQRTLQRIIAHSAQELIENHLVFVEGEIRYKRAESGLTIAGFLRGSGVSALIYDDQLNRIGTYGVYRNLLDQNLLHQAMDTSILERVMWQQRSEHIRARYGSLQSPYEVVMVPVAFDQKVVGVVQMAITASQLEQLQFLSGYLILTILPITLLIMWLVSFYLGKTWLQPLYRLIHLMQTTETHKLIDLPKLPTSVYPEIETLQTALQHLLKRIRVNMDAQKRFTAHAAHELKTPLAQAVSELDVALPLANSAELHAHIQTVKQDLLHINRKLESLLLLTRINDAGGIKPKKVRLAQAVKEVLESFRPQVEKLKLKTTLEVADDDYWWIVPDHLELLLINLIGNAIKYNKRQGTITISSFRHRRKQWLVITDTGVGIAKKEQPHLFKRFFRSEVTAQTIPGYGIGLTVVYSIAQRSHLTITVESTPGKGTSIRLGQRMTPIPELAT